MRFSFNEPAVSEFGFATVPIAQAAFGVNPNQSLEDRLRAEGFNEGNVMRWDRGDYELLTALVNGRWELNLQGDRLYGRVTLEKIGSEAWVFHYRSKPSTDLGRT